MGRKIRQDDSIAQSDDRREMIKKAIEEAECEDGASYFLVNRDWWKLWKLNAGTRKSIGEVDNRPLLDDNNELRINLEEDTHFHVLPQSAWDLIVSWYGGGPVIERKMIQMNGLYQVEIYPITIIAEKLGEHSSHLIKTFKASYSKKTQMKQIFNEIAAHWWLPAHKIKLSIPSIHSRTYKEITMHDLKPKECLFSYSRVSVTKIWIAAQRTNGTFLNPPIIQRKVSKSVPQLSLSPRSFSGSDIADSPRPADQPGVVGLINNGNTCFVNSVLQCLFNTESLCQHFIPENDEIENLAVDGPLVHAFAELITKVWSGKTMLTSPGVLQRRVCDIAPQFSGYRQHDAQEFLIFLLNGLHNELNIVKSPKQLLENKEVRTDEEIAKDSWDRFTSANDSVITKTFYGQLKSTVQCPSCSNKSTVFEAFEFLSVPIRLAQEDCDEIYVTIVPTKKPPITFPLAIDISTTTVGDLKDKIIKMAHGELSLNKNDLFLVQTKNGIVQNGYSKENNLLFPLPSPAHRFFLYELPIIETPLEIQCKILKNPSGRHRTRVRSSSVALQQKSNTENQLTMREQNPTFVSATAEKSYAIRHNNYLDTFVPYNEVICQFVCRDFKQRSISSNCGVSLFGYPIMLRFSRFLSYSELLRAVKDRVNAYTRPVDAESRILTPRKNSIGISCVMNSVDALLQNNISPLSVTELEEDCEFSLRYVNQSGSYCGICDPAKECRGCSLEGFSLRSLENGKIIAIDFHVPIEFTPMMEFQCEAPKQISASATLNECIDLYFEQETLSSNDSWHCSSCDDYKQATKQLEISRLPNVLMIHLKRFRQDNTGRRKIRRLVEFPVENLDLSDFASVKLDNLCYELFAVVNHSGNENSGHYVAFTKNKLDGCWYSLSDSVINKITELEDIVTENAYILFYRKI